MNTQPELQDIEEPPEWLDALNFDMAELPDDELPPDLFDVDFEAPDATAYQPEDDFFIPAGVWDSYLASFTPDQDIEKLEQTLRREARARDLADARFVSLECQDENRQVTGYSAGCLEIYANPILGTYQGGYLEVAQPETYEQAETLYHDLQGHVHNGDLPFYAVPDFAAHVARENHLPIQFRDAEPDELFLYEQLSGLELETEDVPPELDRVPVVDHAPGGSTQAMEAIGIAPVDFDPALDPPTVYDRDSGVACWVGVYQPDMQDAQRCAASVLTLRRDGRGTVQAHLAPFAFGDVETMNHLCGQVGEVMQREGLEAGFQTAEALSLENGGRDTWTNDLGVPLDPQLTQDVAAHARSTLELDI